MFGEVRGAKAAGGAKELVFPCSKLGIGQVALKVSRKASQKCWEKDKVVDTLLRRRANPCRGKKGNAAAAESEGVWSSSTWPVLGLNERSFVAWSFK